MSPEEKQRVIGILQAVIPAVIEAGRSRHGDFDDVINKAFEDGHFSDDWENDPFPFSLLMMKNPEEAAEAIRILAHDPDLVSKLRERPPHELMQSVMQGTFLDQLEPSERMPMDAWTKIRNRQTRRRKPEWSR